jgi:hypothetical protein
MNAEEMFEVTIRHNMVQSIRRIARPEKMRACGTPLEVSTRLARNHQRNGCLDDRYLLADAEQARSFAVLALDFVKRLLERRLGEIEALDSGSEFDADAPPVEGRR